MSLGGDESSHPARLTHSHSRRERDRSALERFEVEVVQLGGLINLEEFSDFIDVSPSNACFLGSPITIGHAGHGSDFVGKMLRP